MIDKKIEKEKTLVYVDITNLYKYIAQKKYWHRTYIIL